jgi:hypothetical protein
VLPRGRLKPGCVRATNITFAALRPPNQWRASCTTVVQTSMELDLIASHIVHGMRAGQYVEAMLGIGQVHIEQARLEAGLLVPALDNVDSELYKELNQEELEDLGKSQGKDANSKLRIALQTVRLFCCRCDWLL